MTKNTMVFLKLLTDFVFAGISKELG